MVPQVLPTAVVPTKPPLPTWRHVNSSTCRQRTSIIAARLAICNNKWERKTRGTWATGESLPPLTSSLARGLLVRLPRVAQKETPTFQNKKKTKPDSPLRVLLQSVIIIGEHEAVFHPVVAYITDYWALFGLHKVPSAIMTDDRVFFALCCIVAIFWGLPDPACARVSALFSFCMLSLGVDEIKRTALTS